MNKHCIFHMLAIIVAAGLMSSCSVSNLSMKTPNYHVEFYKTDFDYSDQVTAEATSVRVLMIDWARLFKWEVGNINKDIVGNNVVTNDVLAGASSIIPIIGNPGKGFVSSYALSKLMQENPGYDVVIYPQYEIKKFVVPLFYSKRTAKVTARLGKLKK